MNILNLGMKKMQLCTICLALSFLVNAQFIPSWKITDLVNYYTKKTDSVYVINFWATFCKPCVAEIPYLQRITKKYEKHKVKLILVSLDLASYYPALISKFATKNNITADIAWLNETDADYFCALVDKKWSGSLPATLFVNTRSDSRSFFEEPMSERKFEEELQKIIENEVFVQSAVRKNNVSVKKGRPNACMINLPVRN
jgi:thiol-disulfide isomerase/thioredoxin